MKGKLHKMVSGYILSLNGDIDDPYAIVNKELAEDYEWHKLSLKNCQAIERGYDLDELFQKELDELLFTGNLDDESDCKLYKSGMYKGVRIIFELLGDKKYSEEDIKKVVEISRQGSLQKTHNGYGVSTGSVFVLDKLSANDIIKSLQQTEWDVEIEMEKVKDETKIVGAVKGVKGSGSKITTYKSVPKLDSDGCLILKRI
jgi:hypothetical protein